MKKMLAALLCTIIAAQVSAEITVGGSIDAAVGFQHVEYAPRPESPTWEPDSADVWVGGLGRDDGDRIKLNLNFQGTIDGKYGKAGLFSDLSFYPNWYDHKENDVLLDIDSIELGDIGGWYQPFDFLKLSIGRFKINTFRGKVGGFNWGTYLGAEAGGPDSFLTMFDVWDGVAFEVIKPFNTFVPSVPALDGINLAFAFDRLSTLGLANNQDIYGGYVDPKYMLENFQIALGYTLDIAEREWADIRFQYISVHHTPNVKRITDNDNNDSNAGPRVQAAIAVYPLEGFTIEIGGTYSIFVKDPTTWVPGINSDGNEGLPRPTATLGEYQEPHRVAAGAQYDFKALSVPVLRNCIIRTGIEYTWGGYYQPKDSVRTDTGTVTKFWLSPSYHFNDLVSVGADFGFNIAGSEYIAGRLNKLGGTRYGAGGYGQLDFAEGCSLRLGVAYSGGEALGVSRMRARSLDDLVTIPIAFHWGL